MIFLRAATLDEVHRISGIGGWPAHFVRAFAVAFKKPRSGRLRWSICSRATTVMEASKEAAGRQLPPYQEYGISSGYYLFTGSAPGGWFLNCPELDLPTDLQERIKENESP